MGKIADLLPQKRQVLVAPGKYLEIRPLAMEEVGHLFLKFQESFMGLYSSGMNKKTMQEQLQMYVVAAPDLVASILEYAADAPGEIEDIKRLPPTVQLIALEACWEMTVPDPKKAKELFSVAMAKLRSLSQKEKPLPGNLKISSMSTSQETSNFSLPVATNSP